MAVKNLHDLYIDELKDLYNADKQAAVITKRLVKASSNEKLREALENCVKGIDDGMDILKSVCERHDKKPSGTTCKGMKGLVEEVKAHVFAKDFSDEHAQDAAIIAQSQRMTHYAIAGYGTAAALARALGYKRDANKLQKCLDQCYGGDKRMTEIAENTVNEKSVS